MQSVDYKVLVFPNNSSQIARDEEPGSYHAQIGVAQPPQQRLRPGTQRGHRRSLRRPCTSGPDGIEKEGRIQHQPHRSLHGHGCGVRVSLLSFGCGGRTWRKEKLLSGGATRQRSRWALRAHGRQVAGRDGGEMRVLFIFFSFF